MIFFELLSCVCENGEMSIDPRLRIVLACTKCKKSPAIYYFPMGLAKVYRDYLGFQVDF
jgi:hypothetical protein